MGFTKDQISGAYNALQDLDKKNVDSTISQAIESTATPTNFSNIPGLPMTSSTRNLPPTTVKLIQDFLTYRSGVNHNGLDEYGNFGTGTFKAVTTFQQNQSILATGIFSGDTITKANNIINNSKNSEGIKANKIAPFLTDLSLSITLTNTTDTKNLQNFLTYNKSWDAYGTFGDYTRAALRIVQRNNNVPQTGNFDAATINVIAKNNLVPSTGIPNGIYMGSCGTTRGFDRNLSLQHGSR